MTHITHAQSRPPVSIRSLKITTNLRIHPDFCLNPRAFARQHGVDLADDVFPETDFRRDPDNPGGGERIEKTQSNIHLVRHDAIRLLAVSNDFGNWIRSIDLSPSLLLYEAPRHMLSEGDLLLSLEILRSQLAPLLADPLDARHIVPGLVHDEEPVAYWSLVDSEILLPGIQISSIHSLSHPKTGPAKGGKIDRIQLGDKSDDCLIRFKKTRWEYAGPTEIQTVESVRVRLILKGAAVPARFNQFGTTAAIKDEKKLLVFSEQCVASVHRAMMSELEGICLPVPPEWRLSDQGRPVTHAKVMALISKLTPIPVDELRFMDEEVRHPSDSTSKRLKRDLSLEVARLVPVHVSTLFESAAYSTQEPGRGPLPLGRIDPLLAEIYGQR